MCRKFAEKKGYQLGERPSDKPYIKLNANESPFPPAPSVISAVSEARLLEQNLYADPKNTEFVQSVSEYYSLPPERILADNGSDILISYCLLAYGSEKPGFYFPDVSYNFYRTFSDTFDIEYHTVPVGDDFSVNVSDYRGCGHAVLLANPNAPSGLILSPQQVEEIVRTNRDHVVVIDEAYVDFDNPTCIPLTFKYDNLIVIHTLSKSYSLAGARLGFLVSSPEIIRDLSMLRASFNPDSISSLSQATGCAAMRGGDYMRSCVKKIIRTRQKTSGELKKRGFSVLESHTNFIFVKPPMSAELFYRKMKEDGVLLRYFNQPRIRNFVRISIGTDEQMDEVLRRIDRVLAAEKPECAGPGREGGFFIAAPAGCSPRF